MSSDIIKNPNRKKQQTVKASKYVPEWLRLGKEPDVREISPSDAMFLNNNRKRTSMKPQKNPQLVQSVTDKPANRNTSTVAEQMSVQPIEKKKQSAAESVNFPQQVKVSVGQNKNWFEGSSEEEEKVASEKISYDDVPVPQAASFDVDDEEEFEDYNEGVVETDDEQMESEPLQPGEYGVIVKGVIILKTALLPEAESMIERILFDQLPEFSQVGIDDIALIKRFPLKVGILAILE